MLQPLEGELGAGAAPPAAVLEKVAEPVAGLPAAPPPAVGWKAAAGMVARLTACVALAAPA
jgi:hypothetical protein